MKVRNGKLLKSERDIERYARDWVERVWRGKWIPTKAENLTRGGRSAFKAGTLDAIGLIPLGGPMDHASLATVIFFEWKADRAKTEKTRLARQTSTAAKLRRDGYLVYQAPEDCEDVIGHFHEWARENGL